MGVVAGGAGDETPLQAPPVLPEEGQIPSARAPRGRDAHDVTEVIRHGGAPLGPVTVPADSLYDTPAH